MNKASEDFFKVYQEHSKNLRTWLVAYGIGAPVLFLSTNDLLKQLVQAGQAQRIALLFMGGVACQILISMVNKYVAWSNYRAEDHEAYKGTWFETICARISTWFWIDIILDLISVGLFAFASYLTFYVVTKVVI